MNALTEALVIERVTPGEHDEVDRLVTAAYEFDYGPREPRGDDPDSIHLALVRARSFDVWTARDATGTLVGTVTTPSASGDQLMEDSLPHELDFRLLAVSPEARRRGIGAALTRHVIDVARDRGLRAVFMKSAPNMLGAHLLYEQLGFRRDPARDGLILGGKRVFDLFAFAYDIPPQENIR